jgi:hypothetical protein
MKITEIWYATSRKCYIPMGAKGCAIQNKQGAINIITRKE